MKFTGSTLWFCSIGMAYAVTIMKIKGIFMYLGTPSVVLYNLIRTLFTRPTMSLHKSEQYHNTVMLTLL